MGRRSPNRDVIIIGGPTGSGKTAFAIDLARRFRGEIVGADSMQIYRYMDIGTAKPTPAERSAAPHHMIDIVDPDADFDAAAYAALATDAIHRIRSRGNRPIVVGGTGFYIKALVHGLSAQGPADETIRRRLRQEVDAAGSARLHRRLRQVDPASAERIHPNDAYRVIRALEVYEITGQSLSRFQQRHGFRQKRFDALEIGLAWPREVLYDRINRRVDRMISQGFLEEVRHLLARGYDRTLKSMQSLGYRHLTAVIDGTLEMDAAVTTLKRDHRRYAKRQLTWFGGRPAIHWLRPDQPSAAHDLVAAFLDLSEPSP